MKTFLVNHTTPKEMADLICKAFYTEGSGSSGSGSGSTGGFGGSPQSSGNDSQHGSQNNSSGTPTGFAGSSGGGSGSGSGGGTTSPVTDVELGGGKVACSLDKSNVQAKHAAFGKYKTQVVYFPQQGTISIYGASDEQVAMISDFIKENDKKQLMAYLEMSVLELNETGSRQLQSAWDFTTPIAGFSFDGSKFSVTNGPIYSDKGGAELFPLKVASSTSLNMNITNIIENGNIRTLANPKMMITNGQKTVLDMTSDYIESVEAEMQENQTIGGVPLVERTFNIESDLGLKVELMPFITPDGYVNFNIRPSYSAIKDRPEYVLVAGEGPEVVATLLQRRNLELNNLRVKDGETLVIAGLIDEKETQTVTKAPFFSDLPLVGFLFRNSKTVKEKTELVILLTPHIVYDDEDLPTNL